MAERFNRRTFLATATALTGALAGCSFVESRADDIGNPVD